MQKEASRESRYDAEIGKQEQIINRLQQLLEQSIVSGQKRVEYQFDL